MLKKLINCILGKSEQHKTHETMPVPVGVVRSLCKAHHLATVDTQSYNSLKTLLSNPNTSETNIIDCILVDKALLVGVIAEYDRGVVDYKGLQKLSNILVAEGFLDQRYFQRPVSI